VKEGEPASKSLKAFHHQIKKEPQLVLGEPRGGNQRNSVRRCGQTDGGKEEGTPRRGSEKNVSPSKPIEMYTQRRKRKE